VTPHTAGETLFAPRHHTDGLLTLADVTLVQDFQVTAIANRSGLVVIDAQHVGILDDYALKSWPHSRCAIALRCAKAPLLIGGQRAVSTGALGILLARLTVQACPLVNFTVAIVVPTIARRLFPLLQAVRGTGTTRPLPRGLTSTSSTKPANTFSRQTTTLGLRIQLPGHGQGCVHIFVYRSIAIIVEGIARELPVDWARREGESFTPVGDRVVRTVPDSSFAKGKRIGADSFANAPRQLILDEALGVRFEPLVHKSIAVIVLTVTNLLTIKTRVDQTVARKGITRGQAKLRLSVETFNVDTHARHGDAVIVKGADIPVIAFALGRSMFAPRAHLADILSTWVSIITVIAHQKDTSPLLTDASPFANGVTDTCHSLDKEMRANDRASLLLADVEGAVILVIADVRVLTLSIFHDFDRGLEFLDNMLRQIDGIRVRLCFQQSVEGSAIREFLRAVHQRQITCQRIAEETSPVQRPALR